MTNALSPARDAHQLALLEQARAYAEASRAENTLDTYKSLWGDFADFCAHARRVPLPASPETVVEYLTFLANGGQRVSTLETKLAAIAFRHKSAGQPDPTKNEAVTLVLDGIRRRKGAPPERKAPVVRTILQQLLAVQPATLTGCRNRALLLIGYACELRRSEIVALSVADLTFHPDQMVVRVARSKTDQTRQGYEIHVPKLPPEEAAMCAWLATRTWLEAVPIKSGPVFRAVDRWEHVREKALTDQVVADIIKGAARAAGLDPTVVSGHSLRRGAITEAALAREDSGSIRKVSRHKTERMLDIYRADDAAAQLRVIETTLRGRKD